MRAVSMGGLDDSIGSIKGYVFCMKGMRNVRPIIRTTFPIIQKTPVHHGGFFQYEMRWNLADGVLESLAGLEGRNLHRGDGNFLTRVARVNAHARCALGDTEGAEPRDRHRVALLQFLRDHAGHRLEGAACSTLRDTRGVRDVGNEVLLGHRREMKRVKRY